MTKEQLSELAKNPKRFLSRCIEHEKRIAIKKNQIQHYRDMVYSITAPLKDTPTFGSVPTSKIENCTVSIIALEEDIRKEIADIKINRSLAKEAIMLLDDYRYRTVLEMRYVNNAPWDEIAWTLDFSTRWVLRLHNKALKALAQAAKDEWYQGFKPKIEGNDINASL